MCSFGAQPVGFRLSQIEMEESKRKKKNRKGKSREPFRVCYSSGHMAHSAHRHNFERRIFRWFDFPSTHERCNTIYPMSMIYASSLSLSMLISKACDDRMWYTHTRILFNSCAACVLPLCVLHSKFDGWHLTSKRLHGVSGWEKWWPTIFVWM